MLDTIVKYVTGLVKLKGGTDGTVIGNTSDSLKVDTELPAQITMGSAMSNPTTPPVAAFNANWNGATWDRARSQSDNADGVAVSTNGHAAVASHNFIYNGTSWDRIRGDTTNGILVDLGVNNDVVVSATNLDIRDLTSADVVTANLSATDNAVLDVIATPVATIGATPLQRVAIFDSSNTQITSFGGSTQYTEGDADASITGTAMLWEDATDTVRAVSVAKPLPVQPGTGISFPVTDNGSSITVDAPVGTPAFVRLSDGASAITTLPVSLASVPSHAVTVASGGVASGAIASGALAAGSIASGAAVSGAFADGAINTLGSRADAKSTATDTTSISAMQVLKQISASVQAPPSQAVTNAGTFAVQASIASATTGGCNVSFTSSATSTKVAVSAAAISIYGWYISNTASANMYVKLWNLATGSVTVGTTAPTMVLMIPAGGAANVSLPVPIAFGTGLVYAAVTTPGTSGTTSPATDEVTVNLLHK